MKTYRFRLIYTDVSEIGIIEDSRSSIPVGESVRLPDGSHDTVLEIYDDEAGKEGDVQATLAVE